MKGSCAKGYSARMIELLLVLIVVALIYWAITTLGLPPMIVKVATVLLVVFVVLWMINLLAPGTVDGLRL